MIMMQKNALKRIGINHLLKLASLVLLLLIFTASCSDSSPSKEKGAELLDDAPQPDSQQIAGDNLPVMEVYSEMGESGMRVTYSPMSLMTFTNVEALESVYAELMACVGLSSAEPPAIFLSDDSSLFHVRDDGTDVQGYYKGDTSNVIVYGDDVDASMGNQYWWTRHGMIEYLINVHDLSPDSAISPFMGCHWPAA